MLILTSTKCPFPSSKELFSREVLLHELHLFGHDGICLIALNAALLNDGTRHGEISRKRKKKVGNDMKILKWLDDSDDSLNNIYIYIIYFIISYYIYCIVIILYYTIYICVCVCICVLYTYIIIDSVAKWWPPNGSSGRHGFGSWNRNSKSSWESRTVAGGRHDGSTTRDADLLLVKAKTKPYVSNTLPIMSPRYVRSIPLEYSIPHEMSVFLSSQFLVSAGEIHFKSPFLLAEFP